MSINQAHRLRPFAGCLNAHASCRTLTTTSNLRLYNSTLNHTTNAALQMVYTNSVEIKCYTSHLNADVFPFISIAHLYKRENMNRMISHLCVICMYRITGLCKCKCKLVSAILAGRSFRIDVQFVACMCELVHMHLNLRFIITIMRLKRCVLLLLMLLLLLLLADKAVSLLRLFSSLLFFHC